MDYMQLIKIDFDNTENNSPQTRSVIGLFCSSGDLTAYGQAQKWFSKQPPIKLHLGYDFCSYPMFVLRPIEPLNIEDARAEGNVVGGLQTATNRPSDETAPCP